MRNGSYSLIGKRESKVRRVLGLVVAVFPPVDVMERKLN